jgi:F420H(2)-dependent quinone reductase
VASKGGADENPAWLLTLRANPDVEVQVGRKRQKARAREVTSADPDYQRLWKLVNDNNRGRYDGYQKLTQREIPLAVLTPV